MLHTCKPYSRELEKFQKNHYPQHHTRLQFCSLALSGCNISSFTLKSISLLSRFIGSKGPRSTRPSDCKSGSQSPATPSQVTLPVAAPQVLKPHFPRALRQGSETCASAVTRGHPSSCLSRPGQSHDARGTAAGRVGVPSPANPLEINTANGQKWGRSTENGQ